MSTRTPEIRLSAPLQLLAGPDTSKLPTKFAGTAYSGGIVPSHGCIIDVSSTTVPQRMPVLLEHDRTDMTGVTERSSTSGQQITVGGKLFSDVPGTSAERIARLAQRGAVFQMSVGLFGFAEEDIPVGHSVTVNGKTMSGPVTVLRNGKVREVSIVTLGADPNTAAQFFGQGTAASRAGKLIAEGNALIAESRQVLAAAQDYQRMDPVREAAIDALFAELGEPGASMERATYRSMSPAAFAAHAQMVREFSARITRSQRVTAALSAKAIYARRREPARFMNESIRGGA